MMNIEPLDTAGEPTPDWVDGSGDPDIDESMDGDAASALASAGMGTDEDYEHNLIDDCSYGEDF